jgi:uncharacterized protein YegP (UPF0339 family)
MSKLARALALLTVMTVATASLSLAPAPAQDKGKAKDPQKKAAKTTGIVEVNEGKDGKFRLVIRDSDEKYLATSAAFATKDDAVKGLDALKAALENPKMTSKKADKDK